MSENNNEQNKSSDFGGEQNRSLHKSENKGMNKSENRSENKGMNKSENCSRNSSDSSKAAKN